MAPVLIIIVFSCLLLGDVPRNDDDQEDAPEAEPHEVGFGFVFRFVFRFSHDEIL